MPQDQDDNKGADAMKQAPTPGPLSASDVKLLVKGDLLRVANADSFLEANGVKNGSVVRFRSADKTWIDLQEMDFPQGSSFARFTFIGPRPDGQYVRHRDGDRRNNTRSNITYGTPAQNVEDARQHGTMSRGEAHAHSTLTEAQVLEIRAAGSTNRDVLAERYGVHRVTIEKIIGRRAWKHV